MCIEINISNQTLELKAGNDMKMPYGHPDEVYKALENGEISRDEIVVCVRRILEMILKLD